MPQLAFFPWIELACDIDTASYSLRRFVRGRLPGADRDGQAAIDAVLDPYRDLRDRPIRNAVILAAHDRELTGDLSEEDRTDLFLFAELFAFSALAAREFFTDDYCNRDDLRLVIQAFEDPRGGAFMEMRRRDGVHWSRVTGDHYKVQVPAHVSRVWKPIRPDCRLLEALLSARECEPWPRLHRGIVLFNHASTDAPDMSDTELVLSYAAMEQILGIRWGKDRFHQRFATVWNPSRQVPRNEWRAPPTGKPWNKANLRECWAKDLHCCRGNLAHGHGESARASQWTVRQHLLLTSFAVPLLVKRVLSGLGLYEATDEDEQDIDSLEPLLNLPDVFAKSGPEDHEMGCPDEKHAWRRVLRREEDRRFDQLIKRHLDAPKQ